MKKTRGPIAVMLKSPRRDVKSSTVPMETLGKKEREAIEDELSCALLSRGKEKKCDSPQSSNYTYLKQT